MALEEGGAEVHPDRLDARERGAELAALEGVHRLVGGEVDLDRALERQLAQASCAAGPRAATGGSNGRRRSSSGAGGRTGR